MPDHTSNEELAPMAFNRNQARPLCTEAEYTLFTASLADGIADLTPAQLRSKTKRARNLRDKYRDLHKRQRLSNRARTGTKKGERPGTNARTADKARLFEEALGRFEARAAKLADAAEREARARAAREALAEQAKAKRRSGAERSALQGKGKSKRGASRGPSGSSGYASEAARSAARGRQLQNTRAGARKGHNSAAGKRTQARRDRRN